MTGFDFSFLSTNADMRGCNLFSHEPAMVSGNDQDGKYLLGSRHLQRPTKGLKSLTPPDINSPCSASDLARDRCPCVLAHGTPFDQRHGLLPRPPPTPRRR